MSDTASPTAREPQQRRPGRLSLTLISWFMRAARIAEVRPLSRRFRLVTLEGDALRDAPWELGQKVQISVGPGFANRTYTPIGWDRSAGRTTLLGYAHGAGPGSAWLEALQPGDECSIFGPRRSLDLSAASGSTILFGDETSFALGMALRSARPQERTDAVFEVSDRAEAEVVLGAVGLGDASLVERAGDDSHLDGALREIAMRVRCGNGPILLTGKASSIQQMSHKLKVIGLGHRLKAKAYWAVGKTGLD